MNVEQNYYYYLWNCFFNQHKKNQMLISDFEGPTNFMIIFWLTFLVQVQHTIPYCALVTYFQQPSSSQLSGGSLADSPRSMLIDIVLFCTHCCSGCFLFSDWLSVSLGVSCSLISCLHRCMFPVLWLVVCIFERFLFSDWLSASLNVFCSLIGGLFLWIDVFWNS